MRERVREGRLADPRHVLDQEVPARQKTREAQADLLGLAEDDGLERLKRASEGGGIRFAAAPAASWCEHPAHALELGAASPPRCARARSRARARSPPPAAARCARNSRSRASRPSWRGRPGSWRAVSSRRSTSAAASMSPAIGTSSASVPTSATAACGARRCGRAAASRSRDRRGARASARWRAMHS